MSILNELDETEDTRGKFESAAKSYGVNSKSFYTLPLVVNMEWNIEIGTHSMKIIHKIHLNSPNFLFISSSCVSLPANTY